MSVKVELNPDGVSIKGCTLIYAPKGRAGGFRKGVMAREYRDGLAQHWLIDRIVDHRDIPWSLKIELVHPHISESTLRRHYGAKATANQK
jgi:hypothetical protein